MTSRKHFSCLFLAILIFSNIGWSINAHSCQGQLLKTQFSIAGKHDKGSCTADEGKEACCDTEHSNTPTEDGCCKNEITQPNLDISSFVKVFPLQLELLAPDTLWFYPIITNTIDAEVSSKLPTFYIDTHAPPLFKLYCKFQFYG